MRSVSARFASAIGQAHKIAVEAEVIDATGAATSIDVLDGSVVLDATAATWATCDLTMRPEDLPTDENSLLAPFGNEIKLSRGIEFPDGTRELVPLGVFRIDSSEADDTGGDFAHRVPGYDRSVRIIEAVFEEPFSQAAGVLIPDAIKAIVQAVYADCTFNFATTAYVTPAMTALEGDDRWDFCQALAELMGCALFFDRDGVCTLAPIPTGSSPPVAEIAEGVDGVLLEASRTWTRQDAVNRVVATSQAVLASGPVYRGVATDDNPLSPTRYGGPFGRCTYPWTPSGISDFESDAQAAFSAQVILSRKLGISQQVSFGALVLPHLSPYDVVRIVRARAAVNEDHVVDQLTIPLSASGAMSGTTRAAQVIAA